MLSHKTPYRVKAVIMLKSTYSVALLGDIKSLYYQVPLEKPKANPVVTASILEPLVAELKAN